MINIHLSTSALHMTRQHIFLGWDSKPTVMEAQLPCFDSKALPLLHQLEPCVIPSHSASLYFMPTREDNPSHEESASVQSGDSKH